MFFYIVLTPTSTTSGLRSTGNTRKYHQIDVYIYQCGISISIWNNIDVFDIGTLMYLQVMSLLYFRETFDIIFLENGVSNTTNLVFCGYSGIAMAYTHPNSDSSGRIVEPISQIQMHRVIWI